MAEKPVILLIGNDPSLEYLLERYANRGGYGLRSVHAITPEVDICQMQPISIWFSSLDMLETFQSQVNISTSNAPIVVCSSIADDARAMDLGADYLLVHPLTYDCFLSTLGQG